jgi:O-antigen/teichoic acid export membrane protein
VNLFHILVTATAILLLNTLQWHLSYRKIKEEKIELKVSWKHDVKPFLSFMGVGHLSNVINFFNYRLVLWIIALYLDNYQLGLFALAAGLTQLLGFISTPLAQVLMPYLSAEKGAERNKLFLGFSRLHFSLMLMMSIISALIAPLLIPILYGEAFKASTSAFMILLIGAVLSGQTRIFATLLIANNQLKYNLFATIFGFIITFIANFYLVEWYGINGAAWAQSITYAGIFLAVYIAILKFTSVKSLNLLLPDKSDISYARKKLRRKPQQTD